LNKWSINGGKTKLGCRQVDQDPLNLETSKKRKLSRSGQKEGEDQNGSELHEGMDNLCLDGKKGKKKKRKRHTGECRGKGKANTKKKKRPIKELQRPVRQGFCCD